MSRPRIITIGNVTDTISGWAARRKLPMPKVVARLAWGWTEHEALFTAADAPRPKSVDVHEAPQPVPLPMASKKSPRGKK
jgi:hypothetical protein